MPHVVVGTLGEIWLVYRVRPAKGGKEKVLHCNALKPCTAPDVEVVSTPAPLILYLQPWLGTLYLIVFGLPQILNLLMWVRMLLDDQPVSILGCDLQDIESQFYKLCQGLLIF